MNPKLQEIIQSSQGGHFITVNGYRNQYGEVSNYLVHANANYDSVHQRSLAKLNDIANDKKLAFQIKRNAWFDASGTEHSRKASGRVCKELVEGVQAGDAELVEAIDKVRKSLENPRPIESNYVGSNSAFQIDNEAYLHNVLIEKKDIVTPGTYPVTCTSKVNAIADWIRQQLPIGQYRTFKLNSTNCTSVSASGELFVF